MQGYLSKLLHHGASPVAEPARGIDMPRASVPLQPPSLPPSRDLSSKADLLSEVALDSKREETETKEHVPPTSWQTEHEAINTLSEPNPSESGLTATALPVSDETTQARPKLGNVEMGKSDAVLFSQSEREFLSEYVSSPKPHQSESKSVATALPEPDETAPVRPRIEFEDLGTVTPGGVLAASESDVVPISKRESLSESVSLATSTAGVDSIPEQGKHLVATVRSSQPFVESQVQEARSETANRQINESANQRFDEPTPVGPRIEFEDLGTITPGGVLAAGKSNNVSPRRTANESRDVSPTRPDVRFAQSRPEPTKTAQNLQEVVPAQAKETFLREAMRNQGVSHRDESAPKLTINRLDIQIINQTPAEPQKQALRVQPQSSSIDSWEALDRHHLGHFYLTL